MIERIFPLDEEGEVRRFLAHGNQLVLKIFGKPTAIWAGRLQR